MSVAGSYDCVTKTPMGDQKSVFTVTDNGDGYPRQGDTVHVQGDALSHKTTFLLQDTVTSVTSPTARRAG